MRKAFLLRIIVLLSNFLLRNVLFQIIRAMSYKSYMAIQELRQRRGNVAHMDTWGGVGRFTVWHRLVTHYTAVLLHGVQRLVGHYSITWR